FRRARCTTRFACILVAAARRLSAVTERSAPTPMSDRETILRMLAGFALAPAIFAFLVYLYFTATDPPTELMLFSVYTLFAYPAALLIALPSYAAMRRLGASRLPGIVAAAIIAAAFLGLLILEVFPTMAAYRDHRIELDWSTVSAMLREIVHYPHT